MLDPSLLYDGMPCRLGHGTKRWKSSRGCVTCFRERQAVRQREFRTDPTTRAIYEKRHRESTWRIRGSCGMTQEKYEAKLREQGGLCAICNNPERSLYRGQPKRLAMDHNSKSNTPRGLLCSKCNPGLGFFQDNPRLLEAAIAYLKKHAP